MLEKLIFLKSLLLRNKITLISSILLFVIIITSLLSPVLPLKNPNAQTLSHRLTPPGWGQYLLGSDRFGRDLFSRILWGTRISLFVAFVTVLLGSLIGISLGLLAGYYPGYLEYIIMRFIDVLLAFPALLLAMAIMAALGSSLLNVIIAITVSIVPRFTRVVHGAVLSIREKDYVQAARALGAGDLKIIFSYFVPNLIGPVVVLATLWIPNSILVEASLSFLGLGIQPPTSSLGNIINEGKSYLASAPWIAFSAGVAIMLLVLSFNMIGDSLRDLLDPRMQKVIK